jgi:ribosomal protein L24
VGPHRVLRTDQVRSLRGPGKGEHGEVQVQARLLYRVGT